MPPKGYGHVVHHLISLKGQISSLRVRGPKWHNATSLRIASVFNSIVCIHDDEAGLIQ